MIEKYINNNIFKSLKDYYSQSDIGSIYGMARLENQHSNFLAWLLDPAKSGSDIPIRNLLILLKNKDDKLNKSDLTNAEISNVTVAREAVRRLDLFITLEINGDDYAIIIENKIYSTLHDDQLKKYREAILKKTNYNEQHIICVFLYTQYQNKDIIEEQLKEAGDEKYTQITYQMIYEHVLIPFLESSEDSQIKNLVFDYIHCLANYVSDDGSSFLIITKQDKELLSRLFKEEQTISLINSFGSIDKNDDLFKENKPLLLMCFWKYSIILSENSNRGEKMITKLNSIISNKKFSLIINTSVIKEFDIKASRSYRYIGELLQSMFNILIQNGYNYKKLNRKFNKLYLNKLIVPESEIDKTNHKSWYINHPRTVSIDNETYYVLNAWNLWEYEGLKERINDLNIGIELD